MATPQQFSGSTIVDLESTVDTVFHSAPHEPSEAPLSFPAKAKILTFNAEFIERRLKEHQEWQERETRRLCGEVLDEIESLVHLPFRPQRERPLDFDGDCA